MPRTNNFPRETPCQNHLTESLARVCRDHLLEEKWLITPSLRIGLQWLDAVASAGQPVVNVRIKTPKSLALELATPLLIAERRQLMTDLAGAVLVGRLLQRRATDKRTDKYLASLPLSFRLAESVYSSLRDLRQAGLEKLQPDTCEVPAKGRELAGLLAAYRDELQQRRLADYADALQLAIAAASRVEALVLVPAELRLSALERQLIEALPAKQVRRLLADDARVASVEFLRAVGEINEVRAILRRCLAAGIPLDEVELLHTDAATYLPLIYEEAARLSDSPLVTFAEGVPARFSRPGRALAAWLAWQRDDFPQPALVRMLLDGLLNWTDDLPTSRLASRLRPLGIGFGRDRYLEVLDELLAAPDDASRPDEDGELPADHRDQRRADLQSLRAGIKSLLDETPGARASQADWLAAAAWFLRERARCLSESDNYARAELLEHIERLAECLGPEPLSVLDVPDWLAALPDEVHVAGTGPQPGCLHVAHVRTGGHSGRPHTFIIGLDTSRWPATGRQDPVLLDDERKRLSDKLPTAAEERENESRDFQRLLARLRGAVTLGYCARSLTDDREMFAAEPVLAAYRQATGNAEANESDLAKLPLASFAPSSPEDCLDEADWWRWRMCVAGGSAKIVAARYPNLGRGIVAATARAGDGFTEFDGCVPDANASNTVFSASRLQTLGACPLRYFYRYVLAIEPPEELAMEPDRWLTPSDFGLLLHEVFYRFMRRFVDTGRWPNDIEGVLAERIAAWRKRILPPSESVFRREKRQLERVARTFEKLEAEFCRTSQPRFLETAIGLPPREEPGPLDRKEPVAIKLPDGRTIQVRGYIDRIDEVSSGRFAVWDYKTFSPAKYAKRDSFDQGRIVQHVLYVAMAEACLGKKLEKFGFFFPGEAGRGERLEWTPKELAGGLDVIAKLCALLAGGAFLPTNTTRDCEYCDFRICCGNLEDMAATANTKLRNEANTALAALRELRPPKRNEKS